MAGVSRDFPVFDCDAHVTESKAIWDYLSKDEQGLVKPYFWPEEDGEWISVNGIRALPATWAKGRSRNAKGFHGEDRRIPNRAEAGGPGVNKKILRKLYSMKLTEEQVEYLDHKGARDPDARLADMDLQGIDQVVVIPLMMFAAFLFVQSPPAAALMSRAYNDWAYDWCSADRQRLFPAAVIPLHDPMLAAQELRRVSARGFKVAMLRPADVNGGYPNQAEFEPLWDAFEETGLVPAMHSLPRANLPALNPTGRQMGAGDFLLGALNPRQLREPTEPLGFTFEAMTWSVNLLLSGLLDRHPGISRMAIMESNATWLPLLLERCDKIFHLYKNERTSPVNRLPSEVFMERCFISFEGDEEPVYLQPSFFEKIGIWASDVYHHDGSDAWIAIRSMREHNVPEPVVAALMGGNARRMYGIEPLIIASTSEPASYPRPDWYPTPQELEAEYADLTARA